MRKKTFKTQNYSLFPNDLLKIQEIVKTKKKNNPTYNNSQAVRDGLDLLYKEVKNNVD